MVILFSDFEGMEKLLSYAQCSSVDNLGFPKFTWIYSFVWQKIAGENCAIYESD